MCRQHHFLLGRSRPLHIWDFGPSFSFQSELVSPLYLQSLVLHETSSKKQQNQQQVENFFLPGKSI